MHLLSIIQQLAFVAVLAFFGWLFYKRISRLVKNIKLGRKWEPENVPAAERWGKVALFALGQKKMFANVTVGIMHFVIYAGFIIINIEILEILLDGILGTHRLFAPALGSFYPFVINFFEWLAFGVIVVCVIFLIRRNVLPIKRFHARELTKWPRLDGNLILVFEIVLMLAFLTWNASETVLRARALAATSPLAETDPLNHFAHAGFNGQFFISGWLSPLFEGWGTGTLLVYERAAWWLHILGILCFGVYVTYSKHLHIGMAFPNIYYGRTRPKGQMRNMPEIAQEVNLMLGLPTPAGDDNAPATAPVPAGQETPPMEPGKFGARDVTDLSWKNLMDAYSCTECGRCTAACPANITGKLLSPRWIMMATRDRMEEIGRLQEKDAAAPVNDNVLMDNYITREELLACTSCNACVEACPVNINPLDIILEMRRFAVMEESKAPASWNAMFQSTENNQAPWAYPPSERLKWMEGQG